MKILRSIFFISVLGILFAAISPAYGFSISPVKMLVTASPAVNQTVAVKIYNSEKTDAVFKLNVLGMRQDQAGLPVFERGVDEAEAWVFPEENTVTLKPGETQSANFIIRVPDSTAPGSRYVGLAVERVPDNSNQNALTSRLISLLTLQVQGIVKESLVIQKWSLQKESLNNKSWKFDLNIHNNGVVEVPLEGSVAIRNWRGEDLFVEPIVLGNILLAGSYRVLVPDIDLQDKIRLPGIYQAQIVVGYGRTGQTVSAIEPVWYFPVWSKAVVLAGGLLFVLLIFLLVKKLRESFRRR